MLSYVFMKILELRPASYDRRMDRVGRGKVLALKRAVADLIPPNSHVLEIGCGTGHLAAMLIEKHHTVHGFDLNSAMVEVARKCIADGNLRDQFHVDHMGVDAMDRLPIEAYGAAVSTLVFSELSDDERCYALEHAWRVLIPGGTLVIADEVVPRTFWQKAMQQIIRLPLLLVTYLVSRTYTRPLADIAAEIVDAGFVILSEQRMQGDAFAIVTAQKPAREPGR